MLHAQWALNSSPSTVRNTACVPPPSLQSQRLHGDPVAGWQARWSANCSLVGSAGHFGPAAAAADGHGRCLISPSVRALMAHVPAPRGPVAAPPQLTPPGSQPLLQQELSFLEFVSTTLPRCIEQGPRRQGTWRQWTASWVSRATVRNPQARNVPTWRRALGSTRSVLSLVGWSLYFDTVRLSPYVPGSYQLPCAGKSRQSCEADLASTRKSEKEGEMEI